MFGLLRTLREGTEVSRLRKRSKVETRPSSHVELGRRLLAQGRLTEALDSLREGLDRFPFSVQLLELQRHALRELRAPEIERLRRRCRDEARAEDFLALVEIHRESEDYDEALRVAEELERCRPDETDALEAQADLLIERFERDRVAQDAQRALALLGRVIERSPELFAPHMTLARLYDRIGAVTKALYHVFRALDVNPDDAEAKSLAEALAERGLENRDENALLRAMEEEADGGPEDGPPPSLEKRRAIQSGLLRISQLNGVRRVLYDDGHLSLSAAEGRWSESPDEDAEPLLQVCRGLRSAANASCRRMGIGAFAWACLESEQGTLHILGVRRTVVVVESGDPRNADTVRDECASFVAGTLRRAEEEDGDA